MKIITISGRAACGKTTKAYALMRELQEKGLHVVLNENDEGVVDSTHPRYLNAACDVMIVTKQTNEELTIKELSLP